MSAKMNEGKCQNPACLRLQRLAAFSFCERYGLCLLDIKNEAYSQKQIEFTFEERLSGKSPDQILKDRRKQSETTRKKENEARLAYHKQFG